MEESQRTNNQNSQDGLPPRRRRMSAEWKVIAILLLALSTGFLLADKYHSNQSAVSSNDRTIAVTGEATVKATPDEFVFNPNYNFKNADKAVALDEMTKKSAELVDGLKKLGVANDKIKTSSNGNDYGPVYPDSSTDKETTYYLSLTITTSDGAQAQKVQDYLATTQPTGQVSPQAAFSDSKRKQLESQARDEATKEARSKADQSAKNLGFKVGAVKSVDDGAGFGGIARPYDAKAMAVSGEAATPQAASSPTLTVQPGENELQYSVSVVYTIK